MPWIFINKEIPFIIVEIGVLTEQKKEIESIREYCFKMFKLGFKPMRPRGRYEVKMKPDITTYICGYFRRDLEYDPYCV